MISNNGDHCLRPNPSPMNRLGPAGLGGVVRAYLLAKKEILAKGYEAEVTWQESVSLRSVTPQVFLREAAWVILCSGMKEAVVRAKFVQMEDAFAFWIPSEIAENRERCRRKALKLFRHPGKVDAIIKIAAKIAKIGIDHIIKGMEGEGPGFLSRLPFIGDITCHHLAKNVGYSTSKADRHLQRVASTLGFPDVADMCKSISIYLDEPVQVVDIVLWRFATLQSEYAKWLKRESTREKIYAHVDVYVDKDISLDSQLLF